MYIYKDTNNRKIKSDRPLDQEGLVLVREFKNGLIKKERVNLK